MKKALLTAAAAALAITSIAAADEVWSTEIGEVIYERDLENGMTVLSYPLGDEELRGEAFIMGLAGQYEGRGRYDGIWVEMSDEPGTGLCPVAMAHPETGEPTYNWGRVELIFVDPDFPGSWIAQRGECFDEPSDVLVGRPIVGE